MAQGQLKDIDEVTYNTVYIGRQVWTIENSIVTHFRNGDSIAEAHDLQEWIAAGQERRPAYCYYKFNPDYGRKYGKLYNFFAIMDVRGFAPPGWHIPHDEDWKMLTDELGGETAAGEKMKATYGWTAVVDKKGNGSNYSEFSGLPGGFLMFKEGNTGFSNLGYNGFWWSSTAVDSVAEKVWCRSIGYDQDNLYKIAVNIKSGLSVRFVRD